MVFVPPLRPPKSYVSISIILPSFPLRFFPSSRRARRAPSPSFVVIQTSAHTSQPPRIGRSHSFAEPLRCLLRVRFVASFESSADRNELRSFLCYVTSVAIKVFKFLVESYFVLFSLHNRSGGFAIVISRHEVGKAISQWLVVLHEPAFL